jgi:hypothetical protein
MAFQDPNRLILIGIGQPTGFIEVPEERFIRNIPAAFISPICMPGIPWVSDVVGWDAALGVALCP